MNRRRWPVLLWLWLLAGYVAFAALVGFWHLNHPKAEGRCPPTATIREGKLGEVRKVGGEYYVCQSSDQWDPR